MHTSPSARRAQVEQFCAAAAEAVTAFGAAELAPRISALAAPAAAAAPAGPDSPATAKLLQNLARPFIRAFFPMHAALTLVFLTAMLLVGPQASHTPCLVLLRSLFQASNLELGSFGHSEAHRSCLKTLVLLLEGGSSAEVLEMLDTVLEHLARAVQDDAAAADAAAVLLPSRSGEGLGDKAASRQLLSELIPVGEGSAVCAQVATALQQCFTVVRPSGRGAAGWAQRSRFLPFVH